MNTQTYSRSSMLNDSCQFSWKNKSMKNLDKSNSWTPKATTLQCQITRILTTCLTLYNMANTRNSVKVAHCRILTKLRQTQKNIFLNRFNSNRKLQGLKKAPIKPLIWIKTTSMRLISLQPRQIVFSDGRTRFLILNKTTTKLNIRHFSSLIKLLYPI